MGRTSRNIVLRQIGTGYIKPFIKGYRVTSLPTNPKFFGVSDQSFLQKISCKKSFFVVPVYCTTKMVKWQS